jgi:hypothetical protein
MASLGWEGSSQYWVFSDSLDRPKQSGYPQQNSVNGWGLEGAWEDNLDWPHESTSPVSRRRWQFGLQSTLSCTNIFCCTSLMIICRMRYIDILILCYRNNVFRISHFLIEFQFWTMAVQGSSSRYQVTFFVLQVWWLLVEWDILIFSSCVIEIMFLEYHISL